MEFAPSLRGKLCHPGQLQPAAEARAASSLQVDAKRPKFGAKRPPGFSSFFSEHGAPGAGQCSRGGGLPGPPGNRPARARGLSPSLRQSINRRHICHRCRHSVEPYGVGCRAVLKWALGPSSAAEKLSTRWRRAASRVAARVAPPLVVQEPRSSSSSSGLR